MKRGSNAAEAGESFSAQSVCSPQRSSPLLPNTLERRPSCVRGTQLPPVQALLPTANMKDRTTALTVLRRATKIGTTTTATKAGASTGAPSYSTFIGATPREDLILTYANAAASHAHRQWRAKPSDRGRSAELISIQLIGWLVLRLVNHTGPFFYSALPEYRCKPLCIGRSTGPCIRHSRK